MIMDKNVNEEIEKRQMTWFGHAKNMAGDRWPETYCSGFPLREERPWRSWRDDIDEARFARKLGEALAYHRKWKLETEKTNLHYRTF